MKPTDLTKKHVISITLTCRSKGETTVQVRVGNIQKSSAGQIELPRSFQPLSSKDFRMKLA